MACIFFPALTHSYPFHSKIYRNDPKVLGLERYVWADSAGQDQTALFVIPFESFW